jgi:hypothetical protein
LILALALNLPVLFFAIVVFILNAVVIWLAGRWVSGFHIASLLPALAASFALSVRIGAVLLWGQVADAWTLSSVGSH